MPALLIIGYPPQVVSFMQMPTWEIPANLDQLLADDEDGTWEDHRLAPILLSVMAGTTNAGRDIAQAWQIEFEPDNIDQSANRRLLEFGIDPDGYGWGEFIRDAIRRMDTKLADQLHLGDCESASCVIWVESEDECRKLFAKTWELLFDTHTATKETAEPRDAPESSN